MGPLHTHKAPGFVVLRRLPTCPLTAYEWRRGELNGGQTEGKKELHLHMESKGGIGQVSAPILDPSLVVPVPMWGM